MKKKNELIGALVFVGLFIILVCICAFRANAVEKAQKVSVSAKTESAVTLNEKPQELELIITREYVYKPLPVDYLSLGNIPPEDSEAVLMAKCLWGEYRDATNYAQAASVCWCICNRVGVNGFADTIEGVIRQPYQFSGFSDNNPVDADLYAIALDVLARWRCEPYCIGDIGRTLPADYLWFSAAPGMVNEFRNAYRGGDKFVP